MAKLSYSNSTMQRLSSIVNIEITSNDTSNREDDQVPHAQQLQVLMRVARMRRRSQRQLLVQIEQEQNLQQNEFPRSIHCPMIAASIENSRSCSGTIIEEGEDNDEDDFELNSMSSSNSLDSNADDA
jgi:hypothetical protein